ncbi:MAG: polysaccharide deacetylase family protein [Flavobacteriales bacterium]|jgi:hypothetical protein|nr:polysaccharide deacetylase family protein [Flavobacteriales bacterium]
MADIHYHIERPGPRSRYSVAHLLGPMAGWDAVEVQEMSDLRKVMGPKLVYGHTAMEGAFQVVPHGLLEQERIEHLEPEVGLSLGMPVLFPSESGDLPFDLFAATFFQLSRYEEYGPVERDEHGRPKTDALHAARHGYLDRPVVDEWLLTFVESWRKQDPRLPRLRREYAHTATLDVDNGAMYRGRPWWRSIGGGARDLLKGHPRRVMDRLAVLTGSRSDPYAVHETFLDLVERSGGHAIVNFLTAPIGKHDHAIGPEVPFMQALVKRMAQRAEVGLHPGYESLENTFRISEEKERLEAVVGRPVTHSRQHFLRLRLPGTYHYLEGIGILEDHSMGLADHTGFRAGTCTAFPFYDLAAERETTLMIHPFAMMDSAMCYKMHLSPREAVAEAKRLVDAVREVQGHFISVWHERFLSGYGDEAGWGGVAEEVLQYARP